MKISMANRQKIIGFTIERTAKEKPKDSIFCQLLYNPRSSLDKILRGNLTYNSTFITFFPLSSVPS